MKKDYFSVWREKLFVGFVGTWELQEFQDGDSNYSNNKPQVASP